jgi:hypothetical protein
MVAVLDEHDRLLMMWRHRFVIDRWVWDERQCLAACDDGPIRFAVVGVGAMPHPITPPSVAVSAVRVDVG